MRHTNNEKRETIHDRRKLPNQETITMIKGKETYKYLGILEADTIKQVEMKEKI